MQIFKSYFTHTRHAMYLIMSNLLTFQRMTYSLAISITFLLKMQSKKQVKFSIPDSESKSVKNYVEDNVYEFLNNSSLHGLKYVGTSSLSIFERIFFSIAFISVLTLSGFFISNVWQKWKVSHFKYIGELIL